MRTKRFFLSTVVVTICTLLYVHQNIEILKTGYSISTNQKALSYSLDQHRRLVYNLGKLKSPLALETRLHAEEIKLVEADINHIYYASVASAKGVNKASSGFIKNNRVRLIDRMLDLFTEKAEARTTKSQD